MAKPRKTLRLMRSADGRRCDSGALHAARVFTCLISHHFWKIQVVPGDTEHVLALSQIFPHFFSSCTLETEGMLLNKPWVNLESFQQGTHLLSRSREVQLKNNTMNVCKASSHYLHSMGSKLYNEGPFVSSQSVFFGRYFSTIKSVFISQLWVSFLYFEIGFS